MSTKQRRPVEISWECPVCHRKAVILIDLPILAWQPLEMIRESHRKVSPNCFSSDVIDITSIKQ